MTGGRVPVVQDGPDVLLAVRVQPRASRNQLVVAGTSHDGGAPDSLTIRLTAPPVEGAANAACRAFLADILGIAPSRILVARGETSRHKLLRLRNADAASVIARLQTRR